MFTINDGATPGLATPENANGPTSPQSQPVKSVYKNVAEILTGLARFAMVQPAPILLIATTAMQGFLMLAWGKIYG